MVYIQDFKRKGDLVVLFYTDGDVVIVKKNDFDRAVGAILNASKEDVKKDFSVMYGWKETK